MPSSFGGARECPKPGQVTSDEMECSAAKVATRMESGLMTSTGITIDTGTNELLCAIRDRVAVITLNRPEVRNALSDHLTPALRTMIKTCGENPRSRRAPDHRRRHRVLRRRQRQGHGRPPRQEEAGNVL